MYFFFSSRRRHTRLTCDWSSDVCSSDLEDDAVFEQVAELVEHRQLAAGAEAGVDGQHALAAQRRRQQLAPQVRSEEHTSELQSHVNLVCRLLLEKKNVHRPVGLRAIPGS